MPEGNSARGKQQHDTMKNNPTTTDRYAILPDKSNDAATSTRQCPRPSALKKRGPHANTISGPTATSQHQQQSTGYHTVHKTQEFTHLKSMLPASWNAPPSSLW